MASEIEFVNYKQFVAELPDAEAVDPSEKVVVCGDNSGLLSFGSSVFRSIASSGAQELFVFRVNVGISTYGGVGATVGKYGVVANARCQAVVPCKAGDCFFVCGIGGDAYRLWAFTDENRKIVSVSTASLDGSDGIQLEAPVNGFLYVNCSSSLYRLYKVAYKINENLSVDFESSFSKFGKHDITNVSANYINTNVEPGDSVSLTPVSSTLSVHQVIDCAAGERFFVYGAGGASSRVWAFIDSDGKLVSKYTGPEAVFVNETEIDAPVDGKLIVNFFKSSPYGIAKIDISSAISDEEKEREMLKENKNDTVLLSRVRKNNWNINGSIITSGAIGSTVSLQTNESSFLSLVVDCYEGDEFIVIGNGGINPRLWAFVDGSLKIISQADVGISTTTGIKLIAPANGKLIVNTASGVPRDVIKIESYNLYNKIKDLSDDVEKLSLVDEGSWVERSYIKTNVSYGDSVSLTPVANGGYRHKIINCLAGDVLYLKALGGDAPRSWAYIDSDGKLVSRILTSAAQSSLLVFTAPSAGKLIVNDNYSDYAFVRKPNAAQKQDDYIELKNRVSAIEDKLPPNTVFDTEYDLPDVSEEVGEFNFSTTATQKTMLEQVYAAFDSLVTDYPDYVTRVDAAVVAGESYPAYAEGYDDVPAYKMYMYKFVCSDSKIGNGGGNNPKKKIFMIAGVHGDEIAAPVDAYIFAKRLCECKNANFFKLRTSYDVYIIPCVNGFGMYKLNRYNGNDVDINRNFPIAEWTYIDEHSGVSAGSEFETKVVCACFNDIMPDIAIDHHNYSDYAGGQFYITSCKPFEYMLKLAYQHIEDFSFVLIKDLPQYFGDSYALFKNIPTSGLPGFLYDGVTDPISTVWFAQAGAKAPMTIEMSNSINYEDGEPVAVGSHVDLYGNNAFAVGQYTLTGMLFRVAGYISAKNP